MMELLFLFLCAGIAVGELIATAYVWSLAPIKDTRERPSALPRFRDEDVA